MRPSLISRMAVIRFQTIWLNVRFVPLRPNERASYTSEVTRGVEIVAVYHSIISTVKLQGKSTWDYLGKFFIGIFNGCRDFLSLTLQNMNLAVCP